MICITQIYAIDLNTPFLLLIFSIAKHRIAHEHLYHITILVYSFCYDDKLYENSITYSLVRAAAKNVIRSLMFFSFFFSLSP